MKSVVWCLALYWCGMLWCHATAVPTTAAETITVPLGMPQVQPQTADTYLCRSLKMNETLTYIKGFVPHANKDVAHHILIYGCSEPGQSNEKPWNCGEMLASEKSSQYKSGPICMDGSQIIYAWAMDAPKLDLPKDVAFEVGGETQIKYLVIQVHYKSVVNFIPPKNKTDSSGIDLVTTTQKPSNFKRAGVLILGTGGEIAPQSTVYMEAACSFTDKVEMHPFAFRTHAHVHGAVISGYRIRHGKWTEIGRKSPQKPQMFYDVTHPGMTVKKGDILAARCTMVNKEKRTVEVGATQHDEMCNFYIMYYVTGNKLPKRQGCWSGGPPISSWHDKLSRHILNGMPQTSSIIPGTNRFLTDVKWMRKMHRDFIHRMLSKTNIIKEKYQALVELLKLLESHETLLENFAKNGLEDDAPIYNNEGRLGNLFKHYLQSDVDD